MHTEVSRCSEDYSNYYLELLSVYRIVTYCAEQTITIPCMYAAEFSFRRELQAAAIRQQPVFSFSRATSQFD